MTGSMGGVTYVFDNGNVRYAVEPSGSPKTGHPSIAVTQDGTILLEQEARWVDLAGVLADPLPSPKTFTPTGKETLTAPVSVTPTGDREWFEDFLEAHGFVLLERVHTDSLEGDDPIPYGEHPGVTNRWTIGGCSTVEAYWLFATYSHAAWFPAPDAPGLTWRAGEEDGLEQASMENPDAAEYAWADQVEIVRRIGSKEIVAYRSYVRGEGGGTSRSMTILDGYTCALEQFDFAD